MSDHLLERRISVHSDNLKVHRLDMTMPVAPSRMVAVTIPTRKVRGRFSWQGRVVKRMRMAPVP